jgi:hypothetical protein
MSQDHDQDQHEHPGAEEERPAGQQQQQPQDVPSEGHAGQGSESALKQMRLWEQHRATASGGKRRSGPA